MQVGPVDGQVVQAFGRAGVAFIGQVVGGAGKGVNGGNGCAQVWRAQPRGHGKVLVVGDGLGWGGGQGGRGVHGADCRLTRKGRSHRLLTSQSVIFRTHSMRTPQAQLPQQGLFFGPFRLFRYTGSLGAAALLLAACTPAAPPPEPVRAVKLVTVGVGALQARQDYSGEVRARIESRLGFRVAGKIVQRQAELGQRVQAGQVLAQLDPQDYQLAAAAAQAQVSAAQTQPRSGGGRLQALQALKEQNFISGAELERREAALKAAQGAVWRRPRRSCGAGQPGGLHPAGGDGRGVVTGVEAEPGQVVSAGTPVVRIAQDGPRDVVFAVPEDKVVHLKVGSGGDGACLGRWRDAAGAGARGGGQCRPGDAHLCRQGRIDAARRPGPGSHRACHARRR